MQESNVNSHDIAVVPETREYTQPTSCRSHASVYDSSNTPGMERRKMAFRWVRKRR